MLIRKPGQFAARGIQELRISRESDVLLLHHRIRVHLAIFFFGNALLCVAVSIISFNNSPYP